MIIIMMMLIIIIIIIITKYRPMTGPHKTFGYYLYISTPTHFYTGKGENGTKNATDVH